MSLRMTQEEYRDLIERRKPKEAKPLKYRNEKKVVNGITFDSAKEARRYNDLLMWQQSGQIAELETQRVFPLHVNGHHVCDYVADFFYRKGSELIVEDAKSKVTRKLPVYRLKKKLMAAVLGIEIVEV